MSAGSGVTMRRSRPSAAKSPSSFATSTSSPLNTRTRSMVRFMAVMISFLELEVFVGRRVRKERDEPEPGFLHTRPDTVEEAELPQRREHHALVREPLDLLQLRFAPLRVELTRLLDEEIFHVRMTSPRVEPVLHEVVLHARGRVAVTAGARVHE